MGSKVVDINVGGVNYTTTMSTLTLVKGSLLTSYFSDEFNDQIDGRVRDSRGTWFIDRDGILFRYILDYLRNRRIILPDNFSETHRLINEVSIILVNWAYMSALQNCLCRSNSQAFDGIHSHKSAQKILMELLDMRSPHRFLNIASVFMPAHATTFKIVLG